MRERRRRGAGEEERAKGKVKIKVFQEEGSGSPLRLNTRKTILCRRERGLKKSPVCLADGWKWASHVRAAWRHEPSEYTPHSEVTGCVSEHTRALLICRLIPASWSVSPHGNFLALVQMVLESPARYVFFFLQSFSRGANADSSLNGLLARAGHGPSATGLCGKYKLEAASPWCTGSLAFTGWRPQALARGVAAGHLGPPRPGEARVARAGDALTSVAWQPRAPEANRFCARLLGGGSLEGLGPVSFGGSRGDHGAGRTWPGWQRPMRKFFGFGAKVRTPLGFCDAPPGSREAKSQELYKLSYKPHSDDMFHWAAVRGDIAHIERYLAAGFDVNYRERKRRTALHFASWYGNPDLITFLLEKGCDINIRDSCGYTPLIKSVQARRLQCLTVLLEYGADPNMKDHKGYTALFYAIFWEWKPMVVKLLEYNAYLEIKNEEGLTPLLFALKENKETIAEFLINNGANINAFDRFQRNTLMYAVRCESAPMIKLLLDRGVDPCFQDAHLWTAQRYALEGRCKVKHIFSNYEEEEIKYLEKQNQIEAHGTLADASLDSPNKDTVPCKPGLEETAPKDPPPLAPSPDPQKPAQRNLTSTSMEDELPSNCMPSTGTKDSIMNETQRRLEVIPCKSDESDIQVTPEEQQRRCPHDSAHSPRIPEYVLQKYVFQLPGAVFIPEKCTSKGPKEAWIEKHPHFKPLINNSVGEDDTERLKLQPFRSDSESMAETEQESQDGYEHNWSLSSSKTIPEKGAAHSSGDTHQRGTEQRDKCKIRTT
ncbi:uncharacterized protein RHO17_014865 [Thomomys bottae]